MCVWYFALFLSCFSLVFHSLNPLPLTVLVLFGLVSLACLSYLATAPVQNTAGDYSGCNLNLQAKWKKFRRFVFCKLPPQTVLESLIVVCRGLMRRLHYILMFEGGGAQFLAHCLDQPANLCPPNSITSRSQTHAFAFLADIWGKWNFIRN